MTTTEKSVKRYTVEPPAWGGTYYEKCGWRCVDASPLAPEFRVIASGGKAQMQRWARDLNNRA